MDTGIYWTQSLQHEIDDLNDGITNKLSSKLQRYFRWKTLDRIPDASDKKNAKQMLAQGFDAAAIGCGLELFPHRVDEALLT
jgi:hypothetical protein